MWTEWCQGKISLLSRGKARVLTLAQLFCISKDVRCERKWRVWNDDGNGTGWWDKRHRESRPPSSSSSCLVLISSAMSQLLFPACPGIHLVPSVEHYFLQRTCRWVQLFGCPRSHWEGRRYSRGFKSSHTFCKCKVSTHTSHECAQNMYRHGLFLSVSNALICLCVHGLRKVWNKSRLGPEVCLQLHPWVPQHLHCAYWWCVLLS